MQTVLHLLASLAVVAVVVAGLAAILGLGPVRDRMLGWAAHIIGLSLAAPLAVGIAERCAGALVGEIGTVEAGLPSGTLVLVILGHVALAVALVRRRLRGGERARGRAADLERARTRERSRLDLETEEDA